PDCLTRTGYRLPTGAEWEYACRAGAVTSRYYGRSEELLGKYAWTMGNAGNRAHPVGSLKPNDLGLFGMLGSAWEFTLSQPGTDGKFFNDQQGFLDVHDKQIFTMCGGSFLDIPVDVRDTYGGGHLPLIRGNNVGFRVARTLRGVLDPASR